MKTIVLAIAHRGASAYAPENTRAAFDLAIGMKSGMIETDVQVTRDGELVLIHDELVDRISDGLGPVADYTLEELQRLDVGAWFAPEFNGQRIVTLEEFWSDFLPRIPVCLEIKDPLATEPLLRFLAVRNPGNRVHVTSFSWSAVLRATTRLAVPTGFLCRTFTDDIIDRCAQRGIAQICPPAGDLTVSLVSRAHGRGLFVRAWGVKERSDIDRLFETGADGATSNWPGWIVNHPAYAGHGEM